MPAPTVAAPPTTLPGPIPIVSLDTSDTMPGGGYIYPNFPIEWAPNPTNLLQVFSAIDSVLDTARAKISALHAAHTVTTATGTDLDAIGAYVGILRLNNESDAAYRARIPATMHSGIAASNNAAMATYLSNAFGVPATVTDGPAGSASFSVTFARNVGALASAPALIAVVKALGTVFSIYTLLPAINPKAYSASNRVGDARVGDVTTGGTNALVRVF